jgi:hypothetical protein
VAADRHPGTRHPAIHRWTGQLQELADATGLSLRQLADHVPWSHSTLARYLNGERVVDEAWMLVPTLIDLGKKRGNVIPVESNELYSVYLQARQAYREQQRSQRTKQNQPAVAEDSGESDSTGNDVAEPEEADAGDCPDPASRPAPERSTSRRPVLRILAAMVGFAAVVATVGFSVNRWQSPPPPPRVTEWRTNIVGTWSQQFQQHLGVFRYRTPDIAGDTDKGTYNEGTTVSIVCQARHRRLVSDPTTGKSSAVWNKLSDGHWIPDLYTDLPKISGETPPLTIPPCD